MVHEHVQSILRSARNPQAASETRSGEPLETGLERPTEYLRQRCPLCFGGRLSRESGDT